MTQALHNASSCTWSEQITTETQSNLRPTFIGWTNLVTSPIAPVTSRQLVLSVGVFFSQQFSLARPADSVFVFSFRFPPPPLFLSFPSIRLRLSRFY